MTAQDLTLLDNPVWHSLQTTHRALAMGTTTAQRYPADVLSFVGCDREASNPLENIQPWVNSEEPVFVVGDLPPLPSHWSVQARLDCAQMVCHQLHTVPPKEPAEIVRLTEEERPEMFTFINSIQPGYFLLNTPLLGSYYGIRNNGQLVAIAGERMRMTGLTEISAVCTHPDFTGKGLAQQLMIHVSNNIYAQGRVPFLHVLSTNERAIRLYEHLGFTTRREIPFWKIMR
ncbi:GNAT family N-acetyltransferase [Chitinophaga agrisoli]|uniref:GNAT family N-acetyltransferase n=1 Tax=Chitinophaga agrisoli TaxID=2607653 RepID=A0A5B2VL95_9BACT|nr:GNAT family N-acetyltransferase [Chitinophaga agrisoli]KAA2238959.1 GNAT family N-acetyltransferase [Chitinophaga agrisoli]